MFLLLLLITALSAPVFADWEAAFRLNNTNYRFQALSASLFRLEQQGPLGFLDNSTLLVVNRTW
jgi:hypothetical protein